MNDDPTVEESPYLTVKQLAARWHMKPGAIYTARSRRRRFPRGFKNGKQVLFPLTEVLAHERANQAADSRFNQDLDPTRVPPQAKRPAKKTAVKGLAPSVPQDSAAA